AAVPVADDDNGGARIVAAREVVDRSRAGVFDGLRDPHGRPQSGVIAKMRDGAVLLLDASESRATPEGSRPRWRVNALLKMLESASSVSLCNASSPSRQLLSESPYSIAVSSACILLNCPQCGQPFRRTAA